MNQPAIVIPPTLKISPAQFQEIAAVNRDVRLERTATGELIVMPPTGGRTGQRNLDLAGQLWAWNQQTNLGVVFDSSTGFQLPNGANRSPDVAWVEKARWDALTPAQQASFPPLCPDFVIELRSGSDVLTQLQGKMREYLANGLRLGWLIDPQQRQVEVYRPNEAVAVLEFPAQLSEAAVLPGLVLDLRRIWG
ncbi:MAG: Uma2 family endonuclease [Spirulinaceae cyanobacterium]